MELLTTCPLWLNSTLNLTEAGIRIGQDVQEEARRPMADAQNGGWVNEMRRDAGREGMGAMNKKRECNVVHESMLRRSVCCTSARRPLVYVEVSPRFFAQSENAETCGIQNQSRTRRPSEKKALPKQRFPRAPRPEHTENLSSQEVINSRSCILGRTSPR